MELNVLEKTKKKLIVEIKGVDHTFCNALKKELWNDKAVTVSAYNIDHPLVGVPKIIVETNGTKTPEKALEAACARLDTKNKEFSTKFKRIASK